MPAALDLTNKPFGRLTARYVTTKPGERKKWWCDCECGGGASVAVSDLTGGHTKSCGCLHREGLIRMFTKHGQHGSTEHNSWAGAKCRCDNPNDAAYARYGGRGIKMCSRWTGDGGFQNFLADMGPKPTPRHTIERIDNDKGYEPGNCKWATYKEQANNKSTSIRAIIDGISVGVHDCAKRTGWAASTIYAKISRGKTLEEIWRQGKRPGGVSILRPPPVVFRGESRAYARSALAA